MSSTKAQILLAVVLILISISIFLAFTNSQAHRLQLLSFSLPRPLRSLNSSSSSSSCGGAAVNGRPPPLKVFMYDLPRRFNFEMVGHRPEAESQRGVVPPWPEKSGVKRQHSVEYWLTASLMVNGTGEEMEAVRAFNGDQAEVFFVPFFSSLSFNTHGRTMTDPATEIDRQLQDDDTCPPQYEIAIQKTLPRIILQDRLEFESDSDQQLATRLLKKPIHY